ncbi:MAG: putative DNA-binding domain-containing protein [Xanthomonadales bacterium]|nr:putative DNA-binding domain-containing protein [Xanthomonadales bacterium]
MPAPAEGSLRDLQTRFAAHIRDPDANPAPGDVEDRRMAIYRELFFNNIQGFIAGNFPVLRKLYSRQDWLALVRDFYARHQSHTPMFPELPREFLQFMESERGDHAGDPPFALELAHYEWAELALYMDENDIDDVPADPAGDLLDGRPVASPVAWLLSYQYPVHRIRPDFQPTEAPASPTYLVVYRRRNDRVRFMELNAVSARLLHLIQSEPGLTGRQYLERIAGELGQPAEQLLDGGSNILDDLARREVLLGTRPES